MNTFRNPDENVCIELDNEYARMADRSTEVNRTGHSSKYSPILKEAIAKTKGEEAVEEPVH
jgi:hypothetical protein